MRLILVLIITPVVAYSVYIDGAVSGVGFVILSISMTVYRANKYIGDKMNDEIQTAISAKPAILAAVGGSALTFTSANVISLAGMCVGVAGLVVGVLQWRENKRRNNLIQMELDWKMAMPNSYKDSVATKEGKSNGVKHDAKHK